MNSWRELIDSGLFTGLAHPDSIKCFGRESPGIWRKLMADWQEN